MKVYVINLPSETERLSLFQAGYPSCLPTPTVYKALSGEEVTPPASWKTSKNRYALVLNFLDILKSSLNSDEPLMICEDDAVFSDDFEEQFNTFMQNVPADYDMLFLGGLHFDTVLAEPVKVNDTTLRCKATLLPHCVIYNPASLQKIIDRSKPSRGVHSRQDWRYVQDDAPSRMETFYSPLSSRPSGAAFYPRLTMWFATPTHGTTILSIMTR